MKIHSIGKVTHFSSIYSREKHYPRRPRLSVQHCPLMLETVDGFQLIYWSPRWAINYHSCSRATWLTAVYSERNGTQSALSEFPIGNGPLVWAKFVILIRSRCSQPEWLTQLDYISVSWMFCLVFLLVFPHNGHSYSWIFTQCRVMILLKGRTAVSHMGFKPATSKWFRVWQFPNCFTALRQNDPPPFTISVPSAISRCSECSNNLPL